MSWGKGKTEKGQGGKLGHSNRDGWGYHDEEKESSRKQRRLDQKQLILDEKSKINSSILLNANQVLQALKNLNLWFEYQVFDSGAAMIDFRIDEEFYCIQMSESKFGWTKVDDETGLCSIPDSGNMGWNEFKIQFDALINRAASNN